jgi:hypothetical protein
VAAGAQQPKREALSHRRGPVVAWRDLAAPAAAAVAEVATADSSLVVEDEGVGRPAAAEVLAAVRAAEVLAYVHTAWWCGVRAESPHT